MHAYTHTANGRNNNLYLSALPDETLSGGCQDGGAAPRQRDPSTGGLDNSSTCIHIYTYATCNPKPSLVYYVSTYIHIYAYIACYRELSLVAQYTHTSN